MRKLERPVALAMPCERETSIMKATAKQKIGNEKQSKTMCCCIVESHESTRQRAEPSQSQIHEDRIAGRGSASIDTLQFGSQVSSDATSDENFGCKSCRGQGMEEVRDNPSMGFGKSQEQRGGFS